MVDPDDWRRQGQERYLTGAHLHRESDRAPSAEWDHDHCEFCWAKFMNEPAPDALRERYTTPNRYHWICATCVRDFAEEFGFVFTGLPDD